VKITWDELKRRSNLFKHGFDFAEIDAGFLLNAVVSPVRAGRIKIVGRLRDTIVVVVIAAPLGREAISIISLRPASVKERKVLDDET
jgi:uncharacterized DUF497 family protein